jgi:hypothetical protein
MSDRRRFPFGQPVLPRPPSATGPRAVFVLGAYPSGFHVAWWLPGHEDRRTPDAKALIVDNEPEVFWDGAGTADLFEQWQRDVRFDDQSWGRAALPEANHNGPSGQWLRDKILAPLGHHRTDCWITDCLDTARLNPGQQHRLKETYLRVSGRLGLPTPNMEPNPTWREQHSSGGEGQSPGTTVSRIGYGQAGVDHHLGERGPTGPPPPGGDRLGRPRAGPRCDQLRSRSTGAARCTPGPMAPSRPPAVRRANTEVAPDPHALGGENP